MSGFVLHPDAYVDLQEISEYIANDNPDAAARVLEELHQAMERLATYPNLGYRRADLTSRPLRFTSVRDFVIVYVADQKPVAIVAVLHGRRSPRVIAALLRGRE